MDITKMLYEWTHDESPETSDGDSSGCNDHNYGPWKPKDRSDSDILDEDRRHFDYEYEIQRVAVRTPRNGYGDTSYVDDYEELRDRPASEIGNHYLLVKCLKRHIRKCHCGKRQTSDRPVKYYVFYCDEKIGEAEDRDALDDMIVAHNHKL